MNKEIKYTIIILLSSFLSFSLSAQDKKKLETSEFNVKGTCGMCKERIENAALIKGVKFAEWNKETNILKVVYIARKVELATIHKAIAEKGHETSLEKANPDAYSKLPKCCAYKSKCCDKH